jgi:predicted nucleic acid-binding protein
LCHIGDELYLVETEFLFGIRPNDRWHDQVVKILELFKEGQIKELHSCASAFLEMGLVLQAHSVPADRIEETLFLVKQKLLEFGVLEVELSSDDLIRLYELFRKFDVEYFDAMHAAVALGRNAVLITNDEVYKTLGVKTVSFDDLVKKAKR